MLILSLFLHSVEEWKSAKVLMLKRLLIFAHTKYTLELESGVTTSPSSKKDKEEPLPVPIAELDQSGIFKLCRPYLILFSLVDKLQVALKKPSGVNPATAAESALAVSHKPEEQWIVDLTSTIQNNDQEVVNKMGPILQSYDEELLYFEEFQEFFDDAGLLSGVLVEASSEFDFVSKLFTTLVDKKA
jgi:hypothetical protein